MLEGDIDESTSLAPELDGRAQMDGDDASLRIKDFRAHATIESILLPYICDDCGKLVSQELALSDYAKASNEHIRMV